MADDNTCSMGEGGVAMSRKGLQASQNYNKRRQAIRKGTGKPIEYTMTLWEALQKAGLP